MNSTLPPFAGLTVFLIHSDKGTFVEVSHPHPLPEELESAVNYADMLFWSDGCLTNFSWEKWDTRDVFSRLHEVPGASEWALDRATQALRWFSSEFARALSIYQGKKEAKNSAEVFYPIRFCFQGQLCENFEQVEALYQRQPRTQHSLGYFELTQPFLRVTDPCYQKDSRSAHLVQALPGKWVAQTVIGPAAWNTRVYLLQVSHESVTNTSIRDPKTLVDLNRMVGVDSAQCGFFDDAFFPTDAASFEHEKGTFYHDCCEATLSDSLPGGAVVQNMGVVSRSGYGDGIYDVYAERNADGVIVLLQLVFIQEKNDIDD